MKEKVLKRLQKNLNPKEKLTKVNISNDFDTRT